MINFEYTRVSTVKDAVNAISKIPTAGFIAGGTNLIDLMKKGVTAPTRIIDINNLPLKQIEETEKGLSIGALAINSDVAANSVVREKFPLLAMALKAGASGQLRNMATVGGNMMQRTRCGYFYDTVMPCNKRKPGSGCSALQGFNRMHAIFGASSNCIAVHPSDTCVALAVLDAEVQVTGARGDRKILFTEFHKTPGATPDKDNNLQKGELITGVTIPNNKFTNNYYLKIRDRASYAFALVSVAVGLEVDNNVIKTARLALGGVAHKPWRLPDVEKFLTGKTMSPAIFSTAGSIAVRGAKSYGHNDFKLKMVPVAVQQALQSAFAQHS